MTMPHALKNVSLGSQVKSLERELQTSRTTNADRTKPSRKNEIPSSRTLATSVKLTDGIPAKAGSVVPTTRSEASAARNKRADMRELSDAKRRAELLFAFSSSDARLSN